MSRLFRRRLIGTGLTIALFGAMAVLSSPADARVLESEAVGGAAIDASGTGQRSATDIVATALDELGADPSPDALTAVLAKMSDEELSTIIDQAATDAELSLDDPEATKDELEGSRSAIDELRDPAARKELISTIRSASADSIANEADPVTGEVPGTEGDPADTIDSEDVRIDMPAVPASDPLPAPTPSPVVGPAPTTSSVGSASDVAADDATSPDGTGRIKPPVSSGADWVYADRSDAASYRTFRSLYDRWWALVNGSTEEAAVERPADPEPQRPFDPFDTCSGVLLGNRSAPSVPTRPGAIFTPTTDTFASKTPVAGQPRQVWANGGASNGGTFSTRWVGGVEQFLIEANVTSSPGSNLAFFWPEIHVGILGQPEQLFDPSNANVDVLCYAQDAGIMFPYRGYVRAWLPVSLLAEPGIQVRADVGNRPLPPFIPPHVLFFGGDMAVVHIAPKPLGARELVQHAIGLQLDDSLIVDTDNNPANDLEGILAPQLSDSITNSINNTSTGPSAVTWSGFPFYGWVTVRTSAVTRPVTTNLSLQPVVAGDDERKVSANMTIGEATFRGSFNGLLTGYRPCYYRHTWYSPNAGVEFVIDPDAANPRILHPRTASDTWADISTRQWGLTNGTWLRPICHIMGIFVRTSMKKGIAKSIKDGLNEAFNAGPKSKVDEILRGIDLTSAMQAGAQFPNGNGVTFPTVPGAGWMRTCVPRGCQGGGVAISAEGIEAALALNAADRKTATTAFRFPQVYSASSSASVDQLIRTHTDANGQPFSLGVVLNNGFVNQLLRSVTEGSAGPDPTNPALSPNGILDQEFNFALLGQNLSVRMSPNVAPAMVDVPVDPGNPNKWQAVIAIPDLRLRVNDGSGWGDPAILGVTAFAALDVHTVTAQTIDPSFVMRSDTHVLRCHSLIWALCTPLFGGAVDLAVAAVSNSLDASLTDIVVPNLSPDFVVANIRLERRGAHLALYANVYQKPRIEVSGWYDKPWYGFHANATFPPGMPITYTWEIRDLLMGPVPGNPNANIVFSGSTTAPDITQHMGPLTRVRVRPPGWFNHSQWMRKVRVRVVASSGGLSTAGSYDMTMITKIW